MKCITKPIDYSSRKDCFRIRVFSDIHLGNVHCAERLLKEHIKDVAKDPSCYWIGLGDDCEWINLADPRFDPTELAGWLLGHEQLADIATAERTKLIELFKPIGDKCLLRVEGNHERSIRQHAEREVYTTVAEGIGANDVCVGPSGFLRLTLKRKGQSTFTLTIFATHGWWAGRLMGSGALNLERVAGRVEADVILAGHDHKRRAFPLYKQVSTKHNNCRLKEQWCISCGTYMADGQPGYAERRGYRPVAPGGVVLHVEPDKRRVRVEL